MHSEAFAAESGPAPLRDYRGLLPALAALTERQNETLHWLCEGKECSEIATILRLSRRTVEEHLHAIYTALGVETALAATAAVRHVIEADCLALIEAFASRRYPPPPRRPSRPRRPCER